MMMNRLAFILILIYPYLNASCEKVEDKNIFAGYAYDAVIVDGIDNEWKDIQNAVVFKDKQECSPNEITVKLQWDCDYLYVLFSVKDDNLQAYRTEQDHPELYLDDMVEILIDTRNDKSACWGIDDIIYHINILSVKKDDRGTAACVSDPSWNGKAIYEVKLFGTLNNPGDTDIGYQVEMAIPWEEIEVIPEAGTSVGINFVNGDNDGNGRQLFDWAGAWPFRSPQSFGTLTLRK